MSVDRRLSKVRAGSDQPGREAAAPRPWWQTATALACVLALIRILLVVISPYHRAVGLFDDDAFYYFGIARNIAEGHGSTFNGLDTTNGYHPLWLLVLMPIFAVTRGHAALVAVTLVSSLVFVASARLVDRLGTATGRPILFTVSAVPLFVLGTSGPSYWYSGMETGLLLLSLLALAVIYTESEGFRATWFGPKHALTAGLVVIVVVFCRLDAVIPMAVLGVVAVIGWFRSGRGWMRSAVCFLGPGAICLTVYMVFNERLFGTPLPVSGQAKALGGAGLNPQPIRQFLTEPTLFGQHTFLGAFCMAIAVGLMFSRPRGRIADAARFGTIVLIGGVLTVVYYAVTSSWTLWPWYFYAAPLASALMLPALIASPTARVRMPMRRILIGAIVLSTVLVAAANAVRAAQGTTRSAFVEVAPEVAAAVDSLRPLGAPIAMGDRAGSLGFHMNRPLVHLEGLVNSSTYLEALRGGTVAEFLGYRGVGLYARGDTSPGEPDRAHSGCRRFTEPAQGAGVKSVIVVCDSDLLLDRRIEDGTSYQVWRYRPELNTN
ncbi:hypothetical protein [Rhodococcus zopfii]|uniref:hypothetical protein n=1 Tax=Rhodococcus zopfii TaxID=43772 RepID=UPI0014874011|nr:hypothetical protein [Rhodococcus zopfii]